MAELSNVDIVIDNEDQSAFASAEDAISDPGVG